MSGSNTNLTVILPPVLGAKERAQEVFKHWHWTGRKRQRHPSLTRGDGVCMIGLNQNGVWSLFPGSKQF